MATNQKQLIEFDLSEISLGLKRLNQEKQEIGEGLGLFASRLNFIAWNAIEKISQKQPTGSDIVRFAPIELNDGEGHLLRFEVERGLSMVWSRLNVEEMPQSGPKIPILKLASDSPGKYDERRNPEILPVRLVGPCHRLINLLGAELLQRTSEWSAYALEETVTLYYEAAMRAQVSTTTRPKVSLPERIGNETN